MKEFQGKKLLILGSVKLGCDLVNKAKEMGAYVIVADYKEDSPAKAVADKGVLIDVTDVEAIVAFCEKENVDGITTGFVDILLHPCYEACKRLGLPFYATPKMLSMALNKVDFKETCQKFGVPVPQTYLIGNEIPDSLYESITYPIFVKPLDASGSRGAGVCFTKEELDVQFADAVSYSASHQAVIEDYLTGKEFLLDYVGVDGEFRLLSMFDRYMSSDRGSAINYSNVALCPSKRNKEYYAQINPKVIQMFKELGFTDGLIFMQGYTDGERITFYEMGCRLGGSFYNLEEAVLGLNPIEMVIRYALTGRMMNSIKDITENSADFKKTAMVVNYLLQGENETVAHIDGMDAVKKMDSFVAVIQQRDAGFHIVKDRTVDKPILSFYMVSDNLEQASRDLEYMNTVVQVTNENGRSLLSEKYKL